MEQNCDKCTIGASKIKRLFATGVSEKRKISNFCAFFMIIKDENVTLCKVSSCIIDLISLLIFKLKNFNSFKNSLFLVNETTVKRLLIISNTIVFSIF